MKLFLHIINSIVAFFIVSVTVWGVFVDLEGSNFQKAILVLFTFYILFCLWYLFYSFIEFKKTNEKYKAWREYKKLDKGKKIKSKNHEIYIKRSVFYNLFFGVSVVLVVLSSLAEGKTINALIVSWLLVIVFVRVFLKIKELNN